MQSIESVPVNSRVSFLLLLRLAWNDFKLRYLGTYLGIAWSFLQPLTTLWVMWLVFSVGFKAQPIGDTSFFLWLMAGYVPWLFIGEAIPNATNSIYDYSYLVKKIVFPIQFLPLIKITTSAVLHVFFIGLMLIVFLISKNGLPIHAIQLVYYFFASFSLVSAVSYLTAAVAVFVKDIYQIVLMLLQIVFWATPIFWSIEQVPGWIKVYLKLNPAAYIVEGYRMALLGGGWFWHDIYWDIYFWVLVMLIGVLGAWVFARTKPHFSDVL